MKGMYAVLPMFTSVLSSPPRPPPVWRMQNILAKTSSMKKLYWIDPRFVWIHPKNCEEKKDLRTRRQTILTHTHKKCCLRQNNQTDSFSTHQSGITCATLPLRKNMLNTLYKQPSRGCNIHMFWRIIRFCIRETLNTEKRTIYSLCGF